MGTISLLILFNIIYKSDKTAFADTLTILPYSFKRKRLHLPMRLPFAFVT